MIFLAGQSCRNGLGLEPGLTFGQGNYRFFECRIGLWGKSRSNALEELLFTVSFVYFQGGPVDIDHLNQIGTLLQFFRMSLEIGSDIPNPGILQILQICPEVSQVLLPEGDGRIFEQGLIMRFALLQRLFRPFAPVDIPEHCQDAVTPSDPDRFQVDFHPENPSGPVPGLPFKDLGTPGRRLGQQAQSRLQLRPGLAAA